MEVKTPECMATSTTEVEYVATSYAVKEATMAQTTSFHVSTSQPEFVSSRLQ